MRPKRQQSWFQLVTEEVGASVIYDPNCLPELIQPTDAPHRRYPALVTFLGRGRKDRALRSLFADNPSNRTDAFGFSLRVDHPTLYSGRPILLTDGDPNQTPQPPNVSGLAGVEKIPIAWASDGGAQIVDTILARFLLPASHVVCIFAEDIGGLMGVQALLQRWIVVGPQATQPALRPLLLVVIQTNEVSSWDGPLGNPHLAGVLGPPRESPEVFAGIHMLYVAPASALSDQARYRSLKEELLKALDVMERDRRESGLHFSAAHLPGLLEKAIRHTAQARDTTFNLIKTARPPPRPLEWTSHIGHFLRQGSKVAVEAQDAIISSSLMLDAFPPNMHGRCPSDNAGWIHATIVIPIIPAGFHPIDLFRHHYRQSCLDALQSVVGGAAAVHRVRSLESRIVDSHADMINRRASALDLHQLQQEQHLLVLQSLFSSQTCLGCLLCSPQHSLACGHALCDACVERYGRPPPRAESTYILEACPLCRQPCLMSVALLPRTAAVRALTVDGGGIRGIVSLQILLTLQNLLGPHCPLPDLIDVAFGTSAGGYIVLDIFAMRKTVYQCFEAFQRLLFGFFSSQQRGCRLLSWPRQIIRGVTNRGLYDTNRVESLLRTHYSCTRRLFGPDVPTSTKIAVTTTTQHGPVILTNYKPAVNRPETAGYHEFLALTPNEEPLLWQCARATSAVPGLFRPFALPALGDCWDGGLRHNMPAELFQLELQHLWPWQPPLGCLLSIGTGVRDRVHLERSAATPPSSTATHEHFLRPVLSSFMDSMDGAAAWLRFWNQADSSVRDASTRLDVLLTGPEPLLNAAHLMDDLIRQTIKQGVGDCGRQSLIRLLAQSLFFELASAPHAENDGASYRCTGSIRCRVPAETFLGALRRLDNSRKEYVLSGRPLGVSVTEGTICPRCNRYCVPVRFLVSSVDDKITLSIRLADGQRYSIGGFPHPVRWFMHRQGLTPIYGFAGDGVTTRDDCQTCTKRILQRQGIRITQLQARRKMRVAHAIQHTPKESLAGDDARSVK
ncbi:hypothetical protein BDV38DRAFT_287741 [Aspergillus pseudotamarii]|uniref:Uncharacterized protein n=1 Tax=Aspergillus pseudotamarii TaxID=132259 RepID=A0A5N6SCV1_ASPPS|nr:uncharacterized protein BDV38DRAFT_287741 [Aspergillus pseudotamarii]KAE8132425.1 hypothetical protein BDV38DRAFT_287741 [Aspergillus pseudotamarii]